MTDVIQFDVKFIGTLRCSRRCDGCYQRPLMDSQPGYQATIEDVQTLLDVCQRSNYLIHSLMFTGGEPTLWDHLEAAVKLAAHHPSVVKTFIVTNARDPDRVNGLRAFGLTGVFVTRYENNNPNVQKISSFYGPEHCDIWDHEWFFRNPSEPLRGRKAKRVSCTCPGVLVYDGAAWSCSMIPSMIIRYGASIVRPDAMAVLADGFHGRLTPRQPCCAACVSNRRIKRYLDACRAVDTIDC